MTICIFKILSGELIIGDIPSGDTACLANAVTFTVVNPFILHYTPQGVGLAPVMPWNKPSSSMAMVFTGSSVLGQATGVEDLASPHKAFVEDYKRAVSPIQLPTASPIQLVPR